MLSPRKLTKQGAAPEASQASEKHVADMLGRASSARWLRYIGTVQEIRWILGQLLQGHVPMTGGSHLAEKAAAPD